MTGKRTGSSLGKVPRRNPQEERIMTAKELGTIASGRNKIENDKRSRNRDKKVGDETSRSSKQGQTGKMRSESGSVSNMSSNVALSKNVRRKPGKNTSDELAKISKRRLESMSKHGVREKLGKKSSGGNDVIRKKENVVRSWKDNVESNVESKRRGK